MADAELDKLARFLGRSRVSIEAQLDGAESREREIRKLRREVQRRQAAFERREEARELDRFADEGRARYEQLRSLTDGEMAQARAGLSLGRQLDQALADATLLTTVSAAPISPGGGRSKPDGGGPGTIAGGLYTPTRMDIPTVYRMVIGQLVSNLHREIDRARLRSLKDDRKLESSADKERRLFAHWEGIRSEVVATLDPTLGSSRSVEMMRKRNGFRPVDGTPL